MSNLRSNTRTDVEKSTLAYFDVSRRAIQIIIPILITYFIVVHDFCFCRDVVNITEMANKWVGVEYLDHFGDAPRGRIALTHLDSASCLLQPPKCCVKGAPG